MILSICCLVQCCQVVNEQLSCTTITVTMTELAVDAIHQGDVTER